LIISLSPGKTPQETALTPDAEAEVDISPALFEARYVRLGEACKRNRGQISNESSRETVISCDPAHLELGK